MTRMTKTFSVADAVGLTTITEGDDVMHVHARGQQALSVTGLADRLLGKAESAEACPSSGLVDLAPRT